MAWSANMQAMPRVAQQSDPVAVFDSGVGGLTVLHELLVSLPNEDFVYFGDTARFPYGTRSPKELREFSLEIFDLLIQRGTKLVVVACNSATAAAVDVLREYAQREGGTIKVIGVIRPESLLAVEATHNGRIGLLATPATVASGAYQKAVGAVSEDVSLTSVECPDLAPIIQSGFPFDETVVETVRSYCRPLKKAGVDTVILGCTHYPLVAPMLQRTLGRDVHLVTSGQAMADSVERTLAVNGLLNGSLTEGDYRFFCTGDTDSFRELGTRFLQMPLGEVERIVLNERVSP